MNIPESIRKIKGGFLDRLGLNLSHDIFVILLIILVALASFGLGRLSVLDNKKTPIRIESGGQMGSLLDGSNAVSQNTIQAETKGVPSVGASGTYVGSKTGKRYYFPWCATANRIAEENKVWFATKQEAEANGYTPASNCKGL